MNEDQGPAVAGDATTASASYSVRAVAGLVIIAVFGGLPAVIDGPPPWAAVLGVLGVVVGGVMLIIALNGALKERQRASRPDPAPPADPA